MLNIGHRGAPKLAPENTLASFERALAVGADGVELDVHLSRDGQAVVLHDRLLNRTTDGSGAVDHHTVEELRRLDAGWHFGPEFAGERIPLLADVLDLMRGRGEVQVELKGLTPGLHVEVVRLVEAVGMVDQVIVTSFLHALIRGVKELDPALRTGALLAPEGQIRSPGQLGYEEAVGLAVSARADTILPHFSLACEELFALARNAGLTPGAWTVDDPLEIRRMYKLGAARITSNVPDLVSAILAEVKIA